MAVFSTIGDIFRTAAPWISVGANLLATVKQFESAKAIERQGVAGEKESIVDVMVRGAM